jgi:hypothetical protein
MNADYKKLLVSLNTSKNGLGHRDESIAQNGNWSLFNTDPCAYVHSCRVDGRLGDKFGLGDLPIFIISICADMQKSAGGFSLIAAARESLTPFLVI